MSMYLGDYAAGETVHFMWNTNAVAGESITRATNGTISVYKDNSDTQTTVGVTDTEDVDTLTGVHRCVIATTDGFYTGATDYHVVLSGATIDGKAINAVLAHFSITNRSSGSAAAIADAVWDELLSGHVAAGSAGERLGRIPNAAAGASGGLPILGVNTAGISLAPTSGAALTLTGASGQPGLWTTGGSGSHGILAAGGSASGNGILSAGAGTGAGLRVQGGGSANGVEFTTSATGGAAFSVTSPGTAGVAVSFNGTSAGLITTGTSGVGALFQSTSGGSSVRFAHSDGRGVAIAAGSANVVGVEITGGTGGSGGSGLSISRGHADADDLLLGSSDAPTLMRAFFDNNSGQTYATSIAGSVVKEIADNATGGGGSATAVWNTLVPGAFASGTAGHTLGMLSGVGITVVSPIASNQDITLVRGDAYTARLGRALTFLDVDETWPNLTDGVVTLEIGDGELVVTGTVVTATGVGKTVRVEPKSSQTQELTEERYDYNLVITFPGTGTTLTDGGDRVTLASGTMHVVDREDT